MVSVSDESIDNAAQSEGKRPSSALHPTELADHERIISNLAAARGADAGGRRWACLS